MSAGHVVQLVSTLDTTGMLRQVTRVCGELVRAGHQVTVISREPPVTDQIVMAIQALGAHVEWLPPALDWGLPSTLVRLDRIIQRVQPRLIHAWDDSSIVALAALGWRFPRTQFVCEYRTIEPRRAGWRSLADRWIARQADALIVNSAVVELACRSRRLPADRLIRIANGASPPSCDPTQVRQTFSARFDLPPTARVIVACHPLLPTKRIKDLLWTIDLLHAVRDDTYLMIIGDGPHRWRLERYARQVHADQRVRFLGWRSDAPDLIAAADLVWSASPFESVPNSILEAMASHVPVITVDTPAIRDIIEPDVSGLLVPVGDRGRLARVTHGLLDDPSRRATLAAAAAATIAARFSTTQMLASYRTLYDRLLAQ